MAVTLFDLVANLTLDTSGFDTNASKAVSQAGGMTSSLEGITARAVAMGNAMYNLAVNAAQAAWNFGVDLVQTAADVQAEQDQFASVFAGVEDQAWDVFNRIGSAANIHTGRLMSLGTGIYTQFASAGMDSADAMAAMEETMTLAADAAAFYNISLEDAVHMVKSFLRGNSQAGESIGLFANDVLRAQYAAEMYGAKWEELNELQRESVLLAIAQDTYDAANATGQAARDADSYTNVLNNLKETWRQIKGILGEPILNAVLPVMQELEKYLKDNPELVDKFADGIGVVAGALSNMFIWLLDFVGEHTDDILNFINGVGAFLGFAPRHTGPGRLTNEDYDGRTIEETYGSDETNRDLNTTATAAIDNITSALEIFLAAASEYNRSGTEETESAMMDAYDALADLLTPDQYDALNAWIDANGIGDYEEGEYVPITGYEIPDELLTVLTGLPDAVANVLSAILPGALSGVQVVLNDNIVGVVSAGMQRNANAKRYTL